MWLPRLPLQCPDLCLGKNVEKPARKYNECCVFLKALTATAIAPKVMTFSYRRFPGLNMSGRRHIHSNLERIYLQERKWLHKNSAGKLFIALLLKKGRNVLKCAYCFSMHWNWSSSEWIVLCLCKEVTDANSLEHVSHSNGFSPVWTLKWDFMFPLIENDRSQYSHLKGFSPVCTLKWTLKLLGLSNDFPHVSQQYVVILVYLLRTVFKLW